MSDETTFETLEYDCPEEHRRAHLLLEWQEREGRRVLKGVQCDNPRLGALDNWECRWTCVQQVEAALTGRDEEQT
jgi:hypothetical protein